jgi:restriction system protein
MPIPDYETLLYPILEFLSDRNVKRTREIINHVIDKYEISAEEIKITVPSNEKAKLIDNRVYWACTYLRKAMLIVSPQRGHNQITEDGLDILSQGLKQIDSKFLESLLKDKDEPGSGGEIILENNLLHKTPDEIIGIQKTIIEQSLAKDLLKNVSEMEPSQFEELAVDLLVAMGYGGPIENTINVVGQPGDGGIDGMIKEDVLGLNTIYLQAKRWRKTVVPLGEVRDFAGALQAKHSNKGVFITTSSFSSDAYKFVNSIASKIILIDGENLVRLMIKYNLGVSVRETVKIKEIDPIYFSL